MHGYKACNISAFNGIQAYCFFGSLDCLSLLKPFFFIILGH
jgi:hypothetical protein